MKNNTITFTNYDNINYRRNIYENLEDIVIPEDNTVKWLEVTCFDNEELIYKIGKKFNLHPLVIEDILSE